MNNPRRSSLVTGGLQGIGAAIVQSLVQRGDAVFVFDRQVESSNDVLALQAQGIGYCCVDVGVQDSLSAGFLSLDAWLITQGCLTLDVVINNAGITRDGLAVRMSAQDWSDVLTVNLTGTFLCAQRAIKRMMRQEKGYLINISSIVGRSGNSGQANYAASKAGVNALTKTLATEYASRNILVNAVAPGFIETAMTGRLSDSVKDRIKSLIPLQRFGKPADIANLVCFLTSGNADYITGQVIEVTGGML